mmetsp:Transcript_20188/g.37636  ORF Transcript_20188/g.37636 Transcript_20188/m.37636 type:complete len:387 (-) Transcript_20188:702-1862(-)
MAEVEVVLKTDLPSQFQLAQDRFSLMSNCGTEELLSLVNSCLGTELKFNFAIAGRLLTTKLHELIETLGLTVESTIEIWYGLPLPEPESDDPIPLPDWVSAVHIWKNLEVVASDLSGYLHLIGENGSFQTRVHELPIKSISCSEQQQKLVASAGKDHKVKVSCITEEGFVTISEAKVEGAEHLVWNPIGTLLACGTSTGNCRLLQAAEYTSEHTGRTKRQKITGGFDVTHLSIPHKESISGLVWPTLDILYTASLDHSVIEWDLERSAVSNSILMPRAVTSFDIKESTLVCGYESGFIRHYDLRSGRCENEYSTQSWTRKLKLNGENFASGHEDGRLILWDRRSRDPLQSIEAHTDKVLGIAWRNNKLVTGGADSSVRVHSFKGFS